MVDDVGVSRQRAAHDGRTTVGERSRSTGREFFPGNIVEVLIKDIGVGRTDHCVAGDRHRADVFKFRTVFDVEIVDGEGTFVLKCFCKAHFLHIDDAGRAQRQAVEPVDRPDLGLIGIGRDVVIGVSIFQSPVHNERVITEQTGRPFGTGIGFIAPERVVFVTEDTARDGRSGRNRKLIGIRTRPTAETLNTAVRCTGVIQILTQHGIRPRHRPG